VDDAGGAAVPRAGGTDRQRPTLEMVAAAAGVSRGTASRALNGGHNVSRRSFDAVQTAAARLGYRPNLAARSLVLGRSGSVGLLVSESDERLFSDPYFATILRGVHAALTTHDVQLVLALAQAAGERDRMLRWSAGGHLDGVIIISSHGDDPLPASIASEGVPVVIGGAVTDAQRRLELLASVDADNLAGARAAVEHLVSRGRRAVGHVTGPLDMAVGRDRLAAWREVAARTPAGAPDSLFVEGDFGEDSGADGVRQLLAAHPDLDAVFCANDLMARGALSALEEAGRRVPGDVAVVGFDDLPGTARSARALTTVHQPVIEMGRLMASMLLTMVDGREPDPKHAVVATSLVVRSTS
jgi:DNA-binding LacI/PurR family transcriptional regulator